VAHWWRGRVCSALARFLVTVLVRFERWCGSGSALKQPLLPSPPSYEAPYGCGQLGNELGLDPRHSAVPSPVPAASVGRRCETACLRVRLRAGRR
jgi:hypothetical protein